jgi:hypothetical protein
VDLYIHSAIRLHEAVVNYLNTGTILPFSLTYLTKTRDSSDGITMVFGLDIRGSIPGRGRSFSLLHFVQIDSETHPASSPIGTGSSFPRGIAYHSIRYSGKIKEW